MESFPQNEKGIFYPYGIFRCKITGSEDMAKLFRFSKYDKYTHNDLNSAQELGLHVELIQDGEANALLYSKARCKGSDVFDDVVRELYVLKSKCKLAKAILSALWGCLCQLKYEKKSTKHHRNKGEQMELDGVDDACIHLRPMGEDVKVKYVHPEKYYKYMYGRIGAFLTSKVRLTMVKALKPIFNQVVRVHTDGFLMKINSFDEPVPSHLAIGEQLGEWKVKKVAAVVKNCNNVQLWKYPFFPSEKIE
jgi:hypothetical protein